MADEDAVEAVVHILAKLCPEAAADAPDEIRYIASMLTDKVRNRLQSCLCVGDEDTSLLQTRIRVDEFNYCYLYNFFIVYINIETEFLHFF